MRTTIDSAGRVVVPESLRREIGLEAGEIEIAVDGVAIRLTPVPSVDIDDLVEAHGRLVIPVRRSDPPSPDSLSVDQLRALRLDDQR